MSEQGSKSRAERDEEVSHASRLTLENWEALGVIDSKHGPLLPSKIRVRKADGVLQEIPICLMVVSNDRRYRARVRCREWARELKLDPSPQGPDKDYVEELEKFELLAYAIRRPEPPNDQYYIDGKELFQTYTQYPLIEVFGDLDEWTRLNDPRYGDLDPEQLWDVIAEVARKGNLLPLMRIGGLEQSACIVRSARAALSSPTAPSRWRLPLTSHSDNGSPASSSEGSSAEAAPTTA